MPRVSLALGCALVVGCFNPNPPTGLPCTPDQQCPPGQQCVAGICNGIDPPGDSIGPIDCATWSSTLFEPCEIPVRDTRLVLTGDVTFDTSGPAPVGPPGSAAVIGAIDNLDVVFVVAGDIVVEPGVIVRVIGDRPLVLAAWGSLQVFGTIDASAGQTPGPGSDPVGCGVLAPDLAPDIGGAGGSGRGGIGGDGGPNAVGDEGSFAQPFEANHRLSGGCSGSRVGPNGAGDTDVGGGAGGGLLLAARELVEVRGRVTVNGAGGAGGESAMLGPSGGSGGGAGGQLILEGLVVTISGAILTANGGGGGGGASLDSPGMRGEDGQASDIRAAGGSSSDNDGGGRGGDGGAGAICNGDPGFGSLGMPGESGGGGGGGGCGQIEIIGDIDMIDGVISPPIAPMPF